MPRRSNFPDKRHYRAAYQIMGYMKILDLTEWEAMRAAEELVEMLKENRAQLMEKTKHDIFFEPEFYECPNQDH